MTAWMAGLVPAIHAVPLRNFETLKRKAFFASALDAACRGCPR